jgi:hypothetical protein
MPDLSIRLLINAFLVLGGLFALWKGGPAERLAALIVVANVALGSLGHMLAPVIDDGVIRLFNDGLAAIALLAVTIRYATPWTGGVMLFFAAQFSLHSYYLVTGRPDSDYLHAVVNNVDWSGVSWCLIIGTAMAWRQRARAASRAMPEPAP